MVVTADQQRVKNLLTETIVLLCKNGLHYQSDFTVEGLLGITLDTEDVFLINIKETICISPKKLKSSNHRTNLNKKYINPKENVLHHSENFTNDTRTDFSDIETNKKLMNSEENIDLTSNEESMTLEEEFDKSNLYKNDNIKNKFTKEFSAFNQNLLQSDLNSLNNKNISSEEENSEHTKIKLNKKSQEQNTSSINENIVNSTTSTNNLSINICLTDQNIHKNSEILLLTTEENTINSNLNKKLREFNSSNNIISDSFNIKNNENSNESFPYHSSNKLNNSPLNILKNYENFTKTGPPQVVLEFESNEKKTEKQRMNNIKEEIIIDDDNLDLLSCNGLNSSIANFNFIENTNCLSKNSLEFNYESFFHSNNITNLYADITKNVKQHNNNTHNQKSNNFLPENYIYDDNINNDNHNVKITSCFKNNNNNYNSSCKKRKSTINQHIPLVSIAEIILKDNNLQKTARVYDQRDQVELLPGSGVFIASESYDYLQGQNWSRGSKLVRRVVREVFPDELILAKSSCLGKRITGCHVGLDHHKVDTIKAFVQQRMPEVSHSEIVAAINECCRDIRAKLRRSYYRRHN